MKYEVPFSKTFNGATYKQIKFLDSFDNVSYEGSISNSQMMKRIPIHDMIKLIDTAKSGEEVIIVC